MKRRTYLTGTAVTAFTLSIAGCVGGQETDDEGATNETDNETDTDTDTGTDDQDDYDEDDADEDEDEDDEETHSDLVGTFDDFEDLDGWNVIAGSLEADTDTVYAGSQSAHVYASESEERVRIVHELEESIDATDVVPGLALAADRNASPVIQLYDEDGEYSQYQQFVHENHPFVRHNFGLTQVSGDPDTSAITEIHIDYWVGDEHEIDLWIDDLHFVPRVNTGRVMLQFQGGFESDYTHAYPILEEHGLTGSTFVATNRVRGSENVEGNRLTEGQLDELVDAGWSVGTVGARGLQLQTVDAEDREADILEPLEWLDDHGYDTQAFAFPGGWYDEAAYDLVESNYDIAYAGRYQCQGWASNPYNLTRISGGVDERNLTADDMIDALNQTAEYGGYTTITFYEMDGEDAEALEATAAHLADLEEAGAIELIHPDEVAEEYLL